ncbi:MAG: hypothetical protein AB2L14_22310 [Candidatus Xenobiia bacterium LiM19]
MYEDKISCYLFPIELLSSRSRKLNLNEWKILNAFYYLKSRERSAGKDSVEISLRMLESDFRLQKIWNRNLTRKTFVEFIPEKPVDEKRLIYRTSLPEDSRSFPIPELYIAPPFPWMERWKKKKSHLHNRLSNLQSCLLFAALLALRCPEERCGDKESIKKNDLFALTGFTLGARTLCDYLHFLQTEGALGDYDARGSQIRLQWSFEHYSRTTKLQRDYHLLPPEEFSTHGKDLQRALTRVLNQCSKMTDPEGAFSQFPFPEFLWILQHFSPGLSRAIRKSSHQIDELLKNTQQNEKNLMRSFLIKKGIERDLAHLITIDFDSLTLFASGGRRTVEKKVSLLLKKSGLFYDIHREVIVAGPFASDARKKSSRKFSLPTATSIFILPSFEELISQRPYRILINVLHRSPSSPTALIGQVVHTSDDSTSFRPALHVSVQQPGELFFRVKCSKEVEHLKINLWIAAPTDTLKTVRTQQA